MRPLILAICLVLVLFSPSAGQITKVEFVKVLSDEAEFVSVQKELMATHVQRMQDREIVAWYLMKKLFSGSDDTYNFAILTVYFNLEQAMSDELETSANELTEKANSLGQTVRVEIFDTPVFTQITDVPLYFQLSLLGVDEASEDAFLKYMDEVHKPVAESLIKQSLLTNWAIYRQLYPRGAGNGYNYVSVAGFNSLKKVAQDPPDGWDTFLEENYKDSDPSEIRATTYALRRLVRMELWTRLERVVPNE